MIKHVPCRNRVTGATADIPETALQHLPAWLPTDGPAEPPAEVSELAEPTSDETAAAETAPPRKRKAASRAAKTEKE